MNNIYMPGKLELRESGVPETKDFPFEIRADSVTEDGYFEGYASVFGGPPDSYGDIVEKGAFHTTLQKGGRNGNGIPMLWHHTPEFPVGVWDFMQEDEKGLPVKGSIDKTVTPMGIPVYSMMKKGAVRGLSIGFNVKKSDRDETTGIRTIKEIELWEVSLVTFPAAKKAQVTTVKDIEAANTPRELEKALREAGLSNTAAKYMVSMCRNNLGRREVAPDAVSNEAVLAEMRKLNLSLGLFQSINLT